MKTENDQENPSSGQGKTRTRGGAVGDDRSKGADLATEREASAPRGGAVGDDQSKGANAGDAREPAQSRGGVVGDDQSKGLNDNPKG